MPRMLRVHFVVISLFLLLIPAETSAADAVRLRFIANAAVEITDGKHTILTDFPYRSGASGYMTYKMSDAKPRGEALCLITHRHLDHFDPQVFLQTEWKAAGPPEVVRALPRQRKMELIQPLPWGDFEILYFATPHANVEHYSYLVSWRDLQIYVPGDTEDVVELNEHLNVDVLLITPWLLNSLPEEKVPRTAKIIIYHHTPDEVTPKCKNCITPKQNEVIELQ